ncbi:SRPBCC family protein [Oceaniovalibus sp. ACAM 378]|uniref:SRPBCC family protein n=1 Tax=Oceaniovalibus sp. ACAM 378 TaxID=2599923 RepID=UPI001651E4DA|nr:SRPBCC family protein [Oceaniovalibus sp. ACAM 378]
MTYFFDAAPEDVFDAWLDPDLIAQWMFDPGYREQRAEDIQLDARVGGSFTFKLSRDGSPVIYTGTFVEISRPARLVLTWQVVGRDRDTVVDVTIEPRDGGTFLTLVHRLGVVPDRIVEEVEQDWSADFTSLARLLN